MKLGCTVHARQKATPTCNQTSGLCLGQCFHVSKVHSLPNSAPCISSVSVNISSAGSQLCTDCLRPDIVSVSLDSALEAAGCSLHSNICSSENAVCARFESWSHRNTILIHIRQQLFRLFEQGTADVCIYALLINRLW